MTTKAQEIQVGVSNWDTFKLKSIFPEKETISNVKREPTELEKISATHTSDRALISRIYKELKTFTPRVHITQLTNVLRK